MRLLPSVRPMATLANEFEASLANSDPINHRPEDLSKLYAPLPETSSLFYKYALPAKTMKEVDSLGKLGIILRKPAADALQLFNNNLGGSKKAVLYGKAGTGKTFSMLNIVDFCHRSGWIVAHVPNGLKWTHQSGDLDASTSAPGIIDQNIDAGAWLQYFSELNSALLSKTPLRGNYVWGVRKVEMPANSTLLHLCSLGVREPRFATDVVGVILKEIRENKSIPVLVAVDSFNGFLEEETLTYGFDMKKLAPTKLALVNFFLQIIDGRKKLENGAIVVATSSGNGIIPSGSFQPGVQKFLDSARSKSEAQVSPDSFIKIHVPTFNDAEISTMLSFYKATGWISKQLDQKFKLGLKHLSDNNPRKVSEISRAV